MLDGFIIEQLRGERDRERRRWSPLPLELPLPPTEVPEQRSDTGGDEHRGVLIINPDGSSAAL